MGVEVAEDGESKVEKEGARVGDSRVEGLSFATVAHTDQKRNVYRRNRWTLKRYKSLMKQQTLSSLLQTNFNAVVNIGRPRSSSDCGRMR
jgi:hypothetical protein